MIYSMTMFFNELDLLELKIAEELPHVDKMIIVESPLTFTGKMKPLNFPVGKYNTNKIMYVVADPTLYEGCERAFDRERITRNLAGRVVDVKDDGDVVICTDIDEIINGENFERIIAYTKQTGLVRLGMRTMCYYLNTKLVEWKPGAGEQWYHPFACTGQVFNHIQRDIDTHRAWTGQGGYKLQDCGNHFTSFGGYEAVKYKLQSYSHTEFATPEVLAGLEDRIKNLKDIAGREDMRMVVIPIDDLHPKTIRDFQPRWSKFIYQESKRNTIEITTVLPCINSCKFCPQSLLKASYKGDRYLEFERFANILSKLPKNIRIDFAGFSEPFANRESSMMMRYAFDQGYRVSLYTTLVGITDSDIDLIAKIPFSPCVIHMPDNTNFIVRDEDRWIENFRKFRDKVVVTEQHYHIGEPSNKIKEALRWGIKGEVQPRGGNVDPSVCSLPYKKGILKCSAIPTGVVLPNGDVVVCCMDYGLKHKLGNLLTDSYEDLYRSEEYNKVIKALSDDSIDSICRYCYVPRLNN